MANNSKKKKNTNKSKENKVEKKVVTEEIIEEKNIEEEMEENFLDEQPKKYSMGQRIFDIVFWVIILFLFIVWIVDFARIKMEKEPKFCLSTTEYKDEEKNGTIKSCTGLGYKIYMHEKEDDLIIQFGSIFSKYKENK